MTQTRARNTGKATTGEGHRNEVLMVGQLTRQPIAREAADGEEVTTFALAVHVREGTGGSDLIDCVARRPAIRNRVALRAPGETIEVSGPLRHRFWRSDGRLVSRYEVEVERIALRGRLNRSPAQPDQRSGE